MRRFQRAGGGGGEGAMYGAEYIGWLPAAITHTGQGCLARQGKRGDTNGQVVGVVLGASVQCVWPARMSKQGSGSVPQAYRAVRRLVAVGL